MSLYADTSLLVSYYVNDANSARAQALLQGVNVPLVFTGLHRLELKNAMKLGVFRHLITPRQSRAAWNDIERDIRAGRLFPQPLNWVPVFRAAAQLALRYSGSLGCRSLDILHVAAARKLAAMQFFSFDGRQRSLAQQLGLRVGP